MTAAMLGYRSKDIGPTCRRPASARMVSAPSPPGVRKVDRRRDHALSRQRVGQLFLALTTIYVLVPSLMVAGSLLLPLRANRVANLVVALVYLLTIIGSMAGESWIYYQLGSIAEIALLSIIVWTAGRWR